MIQTNQEVYDNLIAMLSDEESATIKPKVKYYLDHYVKELSIVNFSVSVLPASAIDRIIFYTKEDKSQFRQMKFTPDGDVLSVMHFEQTVNNRVGRCLYGLPRRCIEKINNSK